MLRIWAMRQKVALRGKELTVCAADLIMEKIISNTFTLIILLFFISTF